MASASSDTLAARDVTREPDFKDIGISLSKNSGKSSLRSEGVAIGTTARKHYSVGDLLYRLSGLLLLQSLLSNLVEENRFLKSQIAQPKRRHSEHEAASSEETSSPRTMSNRDKWRQDSSGSESDSLLSTSLKNLQLKLSSQQAMISGLEDTDAKGLIKQNHQLRETCKHQQSVIEDLERDIGLYHQLAASHSATKGVATAEDPVVKTLSDYEKMLTIDRTLIRELGVQLETRTSQLEEMQRQLDLERWGRQRDAGLLKNLLNDLVLCCIQMPYVAKDTELKAAFEELVRKCEPLTTELRETIGAAIEVALDDNSRDSFLRERSMAAVQDNLDGLTLSQAKTKIIELEDELRRVIRESKIKIIEQMRRHKQATMKTKDAEERLKKSEADQRLVEKQLGDRLRRTRAQLDDFVQSLGHRSSYAKRAAQSVRSFVELLEDQKKELQTERDRLESDLLSVRTKLDEYEQEIDRQARQLSHIRTTAMEEAKEKVQNEFQNLQSECSRLREEKTSLGDRTEQLEGVAKAESEARRSAEEMAKRQTRQIQLYESEVSELRANNQSLMDAKHLLESRVSSLEQRVQSITNSSLERVDKLSFESDRLDSQKTPGIRYTGMNLPRPQVLARSSLPIRTENTTTATLTERETARYSNPSRSGHFNMAEVDGSQTVSRQGASVPFLSLQGVVGGSRSGAADSGLPPSIREGGRNVLYSRGVTSQSFLGPQIRDLMQCLRCSAKFSVSNLDAYEKHIRDCYSDTT